MLHPMSTPFERCVDSAAKAHQLALQAKLPGSREFYEHMETAWIRAANQYEHIDRVNDFLGQIRLE